MRFQLAQDPPYDALASAYGKGLLTPFTGAGISYPSCPLWPDLIEALERRAGLPEEQGSAAADMMRRASRAALRLRHRAPAELREGLREALYHQARELDGTLRTPAAAGALAEIWWPLVLTTNYDELFLKAWNRRWVFERRRVNDGIRADPLPDFAAMLAVGRGRIDCQRVLNSTRAPDNPLLWALQGFLPAAPGQDRLADQLTLGHEEYRRQSHEAVHFRRAFAEIYRSRTLLFLGSGLEESYLLDLFGEALELLGTIGHFHYALVEEGKVDPEFLERRLQILAIEYPRGAHGASLVSFLDCLRQAIDGPRPRTSRWAVKLDAGVDTRREDALADLAVIRGALNRPRKAGVATVVGAGWINAGELKIGRDSGKVIRALGADPDLTPRIRIGTSHVHRIEGFPLFVVAARDLAKAGSHARDAREIAPAVRKLMQAAQAGKFVRVDTMLLAAGSGRTFPQHIALHEMVRGYCEWYAEADPAERIPLWIYVQDSRLLALLDSGRVDLTSMSDASELVRFWIEIETEEGNAAPILAAGRSSETMKTLLEDYAISGLSWRVSVRPAPNKDEEAQSPSTLSGKDSPTLAEFGIFTGSTVIFRRV